MDAQVKEVKKQGNKSTHTRSLDCAGLCVLSLILDTECVCVQQITQWRPQSKRVCVCGGGGGGGGWGA